MIWLAFIAILGFGMADDCAIGWDDNRPVVSGDNSSGVWAAMTRQDGKRRWTAGEENRCDAPVKGE